MQHHSNDFFRDLIKDLAVSHINKLISVVTSKTFTDHWSLATALRRAGLQPEYMSAPWRKSFHHEEPLGGTGV